jgi:hypothetical protein
MNEKANVYIVIPFEGLFTNSLFGFVKYSYINPISYGIYGFNTGDVKTTLSRDKFSLNAILKKGGWFQTMSRTRRDVHKFTKDMKLQI